MEMETTSSEELSQSRKSFEILLSDFNLSIVPNTWPDRAYCLVERFANVHGNEDKQREFLREENKEGNLYFALLDIGIIFDALPYLKEIETRVLEYKLKKVIKMGLPSLETGDGNEARNTLWELFLYTRLRKANIHTVLGEPNPDILSHIDSRKYYFQCKRIFAPTQNSLLKNIKLAAKQLRNDLRDENNNANGIIALSVERPLLKGNLMLVTDSEQTAKEKLKSLLWNIKEAYGNFWLDSKDIIKERKIVAVLLHLVAPGILKDQNIVIRGSQMDVHNTWSDDHNFKTLIRDFASFEKQLNY